ncbi:proline--tRNA ligase [Alkalispirochaeta sphaeroplastigenens]|uniref:Proline--tRNA ligase n=1 Tax=Alkalispirochaeta sphaeroplastigenens TaxID=1187066 RepID=A0A2S4JN68_9SPIO|nr:proline--tRNA ligase [Alkalispirochaeta sphaeroplastigenens]POR00974.1 proline--tRNA ligase [Alkalispirochaeta sphaeroplastigenens]
MLYSRQFTKTVLSVPKDVHTPGYRYLLQAGYIRSLGPGLFSYTPLGMRVLRKIQEIIREEMELLGGQEVLTPLVNPRDIWVSSGRDGLIEQEMVRFNDRSGRRLVLAPTHEEAMVELVRQGVRSYRDLPVFLYQFQTKFRDEARVRSGLVRTREFLMKDAYSFHRSFTDLNGFFPKVFAVYQRIFSRCQVPVIAAQAGVGYMGGERSYEFLMPCESGDDDLIQCDSCGYAANGDVACGDVDSYQEPPLPMEPVVPPEGKTLRTLNGLRQALDIPRDRLVKAMLYRTHTGLVMAVIRGDHQVSQEKLNQVIVEPILGPADTRDLAGIGVSGPWLSPLDLPEEAQKELSIVVDENLAAGCNLFAGSNSPGASYRNVNFGRDFGADHVADIIRTPEGAQCRHCLEGILRRVRAVELGNIFRLGTYYTAAMNLSVRNERGRQIHPHMGCYGIGLGRLMTAIVEANHDDRGIIWPSEVAPFSVYLMSIGKSLSVRGLAEELYQELQGITLYDDRYESISHKLKDADLLGIPIRVVVSRESVTDGVIEVALRSGTEPLRVPREEIVATVRSLLSEESRV